MELESFLDRAACRVDLERLAVLFRHQVQLVAVAAPVVDEAVPGWRFGQQRLRVDHAGPEIAERNEAAVRDIQHRDQPTTRVHMGQSIAEEFELALRRPHAPEQIDARRRGHTDDADRDGAGGR